MPFQVVDQVTQLYETIEQQFKYKDSPTPPQGRKARAINAFIVLKYPNVSISKTHKWIFKHNKICLEQKSFQKILNTEHHDGKYLLKVCRCKS